MDFVESMQLNDQGLICRHRVYWGWFGVQVLRRDAYRRQSMARKNGSRFSEKDMRQNKNLEHIPIRLDRDVPQI